MQCLTAPASMKSTVLEAFYLTKPQIRSTALAAVLGNPLHQIDASSNTDLRRVARSIRHHTLSEYAAVVRWLPYLPRTPILKSHMASAALGERRAELMLRTRCTSSAGPPKWANLFLSVLLPGWLKKPCSSLIVSATGSSYVTPAKPSPNETTPAATRGHVTGAMSSCVELPLSDAPISSCVAAAEPTPHTTWRA